MQEKTRSIQTAGGPETAGGFKLNQKLLVFFFNRLSLRSSLFGQFHVGDRSVVARAEAHLEDAGVAAVAVGEARSDFIEQLLNDEIERSRDHGGG